MNKEKLIGDIRNSLQFLVAIEIFFSTVVHDFFKVIGSSDTTSQSQALAWGIGVGFCILNYLVIGIGKEFNVNLLTWVKRSIFTNLACFIIPIIVFILVQQNSLPSYVQWPFTISLWGSLWMPVVTFFIIMGALYRVGILGIWSSLKTILKSRKSRSL